MAFSYRCDCLILNKCLVQSLELNHSSISRGKTTVDKNLGINQLFKHIGR
jgi:hypothetical protein